MGEGIGRYYKMSIMEQLVNEVVEKLIDDESILKLIEKKGMKASTLIKIVDSQKIKKLVKVTSEILKSILDVIECHLEPLMYNELKLGIRYILIFGDGWIYMCEVLVIKSNWTNVKYLDNEILSAKTKWFKNYRGHTGIYDEYERNHQVFYEVKGE